MALVEMVLAVVTIAGVEMAVVALAEVALALLKPAGMLLAELVFAVEKRVDALDALVTHLISALVLGLEAKHFQPAGIVSSAIPAALLHVEFQL